MTGDQLYTVQSQVNTNTADIAANSTAIANLQASDATQNSEIAALQASSADLKYLDINGSGAAANASGAGAIAVGGNSVASGANSVAMGQNSLAKNGAAVSIGYANVASGNGAVAIGDPNTATGTGAVAIGNNNTATGNGAVALGNGSAATGDGAVALGNAAIAGTNGVAIGNGASNATFTNSVALGAGSVNTADNQVDVGDRTISGVAAGDVSASSTDAVNGSQLYATNQAITSDATAISGLQGDVGTLFDLRKQDRRDMRQGVASAMAMVPAPMPSEPGRIGYSLNGATFRGEYAVGGSFNYRLPTATPMAVGVGFSYAGHNNNGVRVGLSGEF